MRYKPMPAHLLVLPLEEAPTKSGIILDVKTVRSINPNVRAVVQDKGSPTDNWPMTEFIRDGQEVVLIPRNAGVQVEKDGEKLRIVHVSEVICMWPVRENTGWKNRRSDD